MTPVILVLALVTTANGYKHGFIWWDNHDDRGWKRPFDNFNFDQTHGHHHSSSSHAHGYKRPLCKLNALPPSPKTECCGFDSTTTDKIKGGNETSLGQYPWLVYIEYFDMNKKRSTNRCGGSLISGTYVLTAAHCFQDTKDFKPTAVHLGDHYIDHKGPDCIFPIGGVKKCTDGDLRIPISTADIIRPKQCYDEKTKVYKHDIALIRLRKTVRFTDYIRPICLPAFDVKRKQKNTTLYVAGWGMTNSNPINTLKNIKKHVSLPLRNIKDCKFYQRIFNISNGVCAGGRRGRDSCKGDSGGPLMLEQRGRYFLVGVVSYGMRHCGILHPALYTDVYKYRDWIIYHVNQK